MHSVEPEPIIALKTALYEALNDLRITAADLGKTLGLDERQAGRLVDPKARTPLTKLERAFSALGYSIGIELRERRGA
jgi:hypothetical protein